MYTLKSVRFFIGFILFGLFIQVVPLYLTRHAPAWDGQQVAGIPFSFYSTGGGLCMSLDSVRGQCPSWFQVKYLLLDLAIIFFCSFLFTQVTIRFLARYQKNSSV